MLSLMLCIMNEDDDTVQIHVEKQNLTELIMNLGDIEPNVCFDFR